MSDLKTLIATYAQPGRVTWIGLRPLRLERMEPVSEVMMTAEGPEGDHGRPGKRAVTLIQGEHLPVIGSMLGRDPVAPDVLRRNLVVEGINLGALKGRDVQVGDAIVKFEVICAPCSRMEKVLGKGGYSAVRGHGGWCASIVRPGRVRLGDAVQPVD